MIHRHRLNDLASNAIGSNDKRSKTRQRVKRQRVKKCDKRAKFHLDYFWFIWTIFMFTLTSSRCARPLSLYNLTCFLSLFILPEGVQCTGNNSNFCSSFMPKNSENKISKTTSQTEIFTVRQKLLMHSKIKLYTIFVTVLDREKVRWL